MNVIRDAMLKAADQIEGDPGRFHFMAIGIPHPCGTPGCALGWTGYFAGCNGGFSDVCKMMDLPIIRPELPEHGEFEFYRRMDEIHGGRDWRMDAKACADAMRLYADKYHPAESRALIPASVTRIFQMSHAELAAELA